MAVASPSWMGAAGVFSLFIATGALGYYFAVTRQGPPPRAVAGSPTAGEGKGGAAELPPGHPQVPLPEEIKQFLDDLTAKAEAAPKDLEAWQRLARARYRAGLLDASHFDSALSALAHVIELDPENLEALRTYGNIAYERGNYAEAEKRFQLYLDIDPNDPGVRTDQASAVLFQGRSQEAEALYGKIIASDPTFVQAHVNLGIALHARGKKEDALASLKRGRELAKEPIQIEQIDRILATVEGKAPNAAAFAAPPATPDTPKRVASNASSPFQKNVDLLFTEHRIVGPRVVRIEWTGESMATVRLREFPMDQMPPVMRNKFKSGINRSITELGQKHALTSEVVVELIDDTSGQAMDRLDGKEWVGAFDEETYN